MPQMYGQGQEDPPAAADAGSGGGARGAEVAVPDAPGPGTDGAAPEPGLDLPLLAAFLVILALVIASNVWLRRRATRSGEGEADARD